MPPDIKIEVVAASPERQVLLELSAPAGTTLGEIIESSRILKRFPGFDQESLQFGIWGRVVSMEHVLEEGDRVEVYRPLRIDPREARRQLALAGKTMRGDNKA